MLLGFEKELQQGFRASLGKDYPDSSEEVDAGLPKPLIDEIYITAFVDSDHAHNKITRRSVTGMVIMLGRTPVFFSSM
jgi:hypothetical protein